MPNDDLISRKALLEDLRTILMSDVFPNWANMEMKTKCSLGILGEKFKREIEAAPAVDAEPVRHGRWIRQDDTFTRYMCSECESKNHAGHENYCPNCGVKMDEKEG